MRRSGQNSQINFRGSSILEEGGACEAVRSNSQINFRGSSILEDGRACEFYLSLPISLPIVPN